MSENNKIEEKLLRLFDFQKFLQNERLANIIEQVENKYDSSLSDDELEFVNAAGDVSYTSIPQKSNNPLEEKSDE